MVWHHQYLPTIEAVAGGRYGADDAVFPAAVGGGDDGYCFDSGIR
jgi:hypothetical protein